MEYYIQEKSKHATRWTNVSEYRKSYKNYSIAMKELNRLRNDPENIELKYKFRIILVCEHVITKVSDSHSDMLVYIIEY